MKLWITTLTIFAQILGFISAMILYYMLFVAIGVWAGHTWIGNLLYAVVTVFIVAFFAAKEKLGAEL